MEFSLVGYTVFLQAAVGLALLAGLKAFTFSEEAEKITWRIAFLFSLIGGVASVLHLHDVFNSPYTITQVGHAWMSREIVLTGVFVLLVFLRMINVLKSGLNWLVAAAGVILVLAMAQIYVQNISMPLWRNAGTYLSFLASTLLLGGFAGFAISNSFGGSDASIKKSLALVLLGAPFVLVMPIFWTVLLPAEVINGASVEDLMLSLPCMALFSAGSIALAGAVSVFSWGKACTISWIAFVLALSGTLVGRALFYLASIKTGF